MTAAALSASLAGGFTRLSHDLNRRALSEFSPLEYQIWSYLYRETVGWNRPAAAVSIATLCRITRRSRSQVYRAVRQLARRGAIQISRRNGGRGLASIYELGTSWKRIQAQPETVSNRPGNRAVKHSVKQCHQDGTVSTQNRTTGGTVSGGPYKEGKKGVVGVCGCSAEDATEPTTHTPAEEALRTENARLAAEVEKLRAELEALKLQTKSQEAQEAKPEQSETWRQVAAVMQRYSQACQKAPDSGIISRTVAALSGAGVKALERRIAKRESAGFRISSFGAFPALAADAAAAAAAPRAGMVNEPPAPEPTDEELAEAARKIAEREAEMKAEEAAQLAAETAWQQMPAAERRQFEREISADLKARTGRQDVNPLMIQHEGIRRLARQLREAQ